MSLARLIQMGASGVAAPAGDTSFVPSDISDLQIWLDASSTSYLFQDAAKTTAVTTNGDPVGCWADRSGNGYDHTVSTTANRPSYDTSTISGGSLFFDHTADSNAGEWLYNSTSKDLITAFFVVETSVINSQVLFGFDNSDNKYIHYDIGGTVYGTHQTSLYTQFSTAGYTGFPTNKETLLTVDNLNFYKVNLVKYAPDTVYNYTGGSGAGTYIGRRANAIGIHAPYRGNIAEIICYNKRLTSAEILEVEAYLKAKWSLDIGYNIATGTKNTTYLASPHGTNTGYFRWSYDGTKFFLIADSNDVHRHTASTAWDITSVSSTVDNEKTFTETVKSIFFKSDGTKAYTLEDAATDIIRQYSLSTAWDISTATSDSKSYSSLQTSSADDFFIRADGLKLYTMGSATDKVFQHTLSTAWDISTASYDSVEFDLATAGSQTNPASMWFEPTGDRFWVHGNATDDIRQYSMSTQWDLSTAAYDSIDYDDADLVGPTALQFNSDGSKLYFGRALNDRIWEVDIT